MLLLLHTGQANLQEEAAEPGEFKKLFRQKAEFISWNQYQRLTLSAGHIQAVTQKVQRGRPLHLKAWRDKMPDLQLTGANDHTQAHQDTSGILHFEISSPLFSGTPVTQCPQTWALGNLVWSSLAPGICTMCTMTLGTKHSFAPLHSCLHCIIQT